MKLFNLFKKQQPAEFTRESVTVEEPHLEVELNSGADSILYRVIESTVVEYDRLLHSENMSLHEIHDAGAKYYAEIESDSHTDESRSGEEMTWYPNKPGKANNPPVSFYYPFKGKNAKTTPVKTERKELYKGTPADILAYLKLEGYDRDLEMHTIRIVHRK